MRAMRLHRPGAPLRLETIPTPAPQAGQVLIRVAACGVCRTDLHVADGDLPPATKSPIIPGHEIVGYVAATGKGVVDITPGDRVGVPWLGRSCGSCAFCRKGQENLCDQPGFTGYTLNGGYAEYTVADARFCFPLPPGGSPADDVADAPLMCAGLIGFRAYNMVRDATAIGLYGFGAAAHILCQIAAFEGKRVHGLARPGDSGAAAFARQLGAVWAGGSDETPPEALDAAILFAPVGELVPIALGHVRKGGTVVCAGIHMSDIPRFPYALLWGERVVRSVANLTRADGEAFFPLAARAGVRTASTVFPLADANRALAELRAGRVRGAAVLVP
ncbi:MAG: zinc-dependent alcohol dehydrogenase family protein [Nitrospirota bacterium]|nr:zinc-dependent alcohol dehydrogenase family protein [Nitrospirota bacterium]